MARNGGMAIWITFKPIVEVGPKGSSGHGFPKVFVSSGDNAHIDRYCSSSYAFYHAFLQYPEKRRLSTHAQISQFIQEKRTAMS